MALQLAPIAHETTQTVGTGAYTLDGAITGRNTFASHMATNDTVYFQVRDGGSPPTWELNLGTFNASGALERTTFLGSSTGAAISWATGVKDIYSVPIAEVESFLLAANNLSDVQDAGTSRTNLGLGTAALENVTKFLRTDAGTNTQEPASGNAALVVRTPDTAAGLALIDLAEGVGSNDKRVRLGWSASAEEAFINLFDGVDDERVATILQNAWTFGPGVSVTLAQDAVSALEAVTKQQLDAAVSAANDPAFSSGDEIIIAAGTLPPGWSIVTTAANDRIPLFVDTLAETKVNAGANAINALAVTVNSHTLTLSQIPSHTHSVTVHIDRLTDSKGPGPGNLLNDLVASAGDDSQSYTTNSQGGGGGHSHGASISTPLTRTFCVIAKS